MRVDSLSAFCLRPLSSSLMRAHSADALSRSICRESERTAMRTAGDTHARALKAASHSMCRRNELSVRTAVAQSNRRSNGRRRRRRPNVIGRP